MKYLFRPNENKIYDALMYPSYIQFKEEQMLQIDNFDELIQKEYWEICRVQKKVLMPYQTKLEAFYFTDFNLITLLFQRYPFWDHPSADAYLAYLETCSVEAINEATLIALIEKSGEKFNDPESTSLAYSLLESNTKLMDWLDVASISSDSKWHIMKFLKAPLQGIKDLRSTMQDINHLFESFYARYDERIKTYQIDFVKRLSQLDGDALSQLTNGIVKDNHTGDGPCILFITAVEPYSIHIYPNATLNFAAWGYEVENIMHLAIAQNENQISERVLLFKNLGDRTKYDCLRCIAEGMTSTKKIAEKLGVSSATISYHLNTLLTAKLIELEQKQGRYKHVINKNHVLQSLEGLKDDLKID